MYVFVNNDLLYCKCVLQWQRLFEHSMARDQIRWKTLAPIPIRVGDPGLAHS